MMCGLLFLFAFCLIGIGMTTGQPHLRMTEPLVTIQEGTLKGVIGENFDGQKFYKFFGIPYAKPPVNELRFQPPQPAEAWTGVRDANKIGDACLSRDDFTPALIGSEDCLYLNVYTKEIPLKEKNVSLKPVMVFIHGGGLTIGSSNPEHYGPEFLMLKDIVLVTLNYRLGVLGFLSFDDPELKVYGNMGLKDQNLALKWVQKNIKSFGGDPGNVTIFGNSAGSSSVHAHILSKASKGLFHKAIMQSGVTLNSWFWGSKNNARELVSNAGRTATTEKEALNILKSLPALEIHAAQEKLYDPPYPSGRRPLSAVVEIPNKDAFLTENPIKIIKEGNYNQVPMIFGYTVNEGMLLDMDMRTAAQTGAKIPPFDFNNIIPVDMNVTKGSTESKEILGALKELYSGKPKSARYDPMTDAYFLTGIIESIKLHLINAQNPIYLYRLSLEGQLNLLKRLLNRTDEPGVCHGDELGYLFYTEITVPVKPGSLEDRSLRAFVELWTNFAASGNPTPNENLKVTWKPIVSKENIQVFDIGETLEMKNIPERNRLEIWWKIMEKYPLVKLS